MFWIVRYWWSCPAKDDENEGKHEASLVFVSVFERYWWSHPAKDEEDECEHEAGVVAVGFVLCCSSQVPSPGAVGSKNHHRSLKRWQCNDVIIIIQWSSGDYNNQSYPNGESKFTEPHHSGDEGDAVDSTLLPASNLPILLNKSINYCAKKN